MCIRDRCSNNGIICREGICYLKVGRTYTNPIISDKSVPDPTVVRANDGHFYLYATQTSTYWMPIYRSKDLVNWEYQKTAFTQATKPSLSGGGAFWAPEMQYINGKYVLYFSWAKMNGADVSLSLIHIFGNLSCWSCLQVNYTVTLQIAVVLVWKDMTQIQVRQWLFLLMEERHGAPTLALLLIMYCE